MRAPADEPLVVLGSAGSGKTTVALHRLARLVAAEPERVPLSRARVVVPEEGLARLAARLLAPLGGGAAKVQTLDAAFLELARRVFGTLPRIVDDPPALVTAVKRHPALFDALRMRLAHRRGTGAPSWRRLRRELSVPLTDRTFLGRVVERAGGTLPRTIVEETVRHTIRQIADPITRLLASITDESRKEAVDGRPIDEGTDDALAGTLDVEDLPLLLALAAWRGQLSLPEASHLVLDEAEDFSLFDLETLANLLQGTRSVTVAGDEAQQTSPSFAGWDRSLQTLGAAGAARVRLAGLVPLPEAHRRPGPGHPRTAGPTASRPGGPGRGAGGPLLRSLASRRRTCSWPARSASCSSPSRTPRWPSSATTRAPRGGVARRALGDSRRAGWCSTGASASSPGST